jgi:hypothetical protein
MIFGQPMFTAVIFAAEWTFERQSNFHVTVLTFHGKLHLPLRVAMTLHGTCDLNFFHLPNC